LSFTIFVVKSRRLPGN